ncbi:MAG TPA: GspH/FimT family pseudopilin [Rhodanobacter sp.]|nr:GspH/FimT family pseudopilin [Rhodanobacter sp.]
MRGFTLIELIITMVIAAVLIMIAVPSFKNITLTNRLTTTANEVVAAISSARMEAIKRNATTQVCGNTGNGSGVGALCGTATGAVYVMTNNSAELLLAGTTGIASPITLTGNMTPLRFGGDGLAHTVASTAPYSGLVADISTDAITTDNHRCITMTAGSILSTTTQSTACATP